VQHCWTKLPIPANAINRVSQLGSDQGMPCCLTFSNQYGVIINTNDDNEDASQSVDLTYQPSNDSDDNDHLIKMGNYMDNDDSDIPDQDSNDSGKSSSDISKESNSEDGELTNQSEIIPVNRAMEDKDASDTSSGENSQVDILANKDHHLHPRGFLTS